MKQDLWTIQYSYGETKNIKAGVWGYPIGVWMTLALCCAYKGLIPMDLSGIKQPTQAWANSGTHQAQILVQNTFDGNNLPETGTKITLP